MLWGSSNSTYGPRNLCFRHAVFPEEGGYAQLRGTDPITLEITISTENIRLSQFLKLANAVGSGTEAKFIIQEGEVFVNSELETRRGRKLINGDIVEFQNEQYQVLSLH